MEGLFGCARNSGVGRCQGVGSNSPAGECHIHRRPRARGRHSRGKPRIEGNLKRDKDLFL